MSDFEEASAQAAIDLFGSAEQRARFAGKRVIMAVSEPDAGSDIAAITAKAVRDGDDFIIDGQKKYIAGVADSDYLAVVVRTGRDGPAHRQLSTILVPVGAEGVEVQPILDMLGRHRSDKVFFTGVRVPIANLLGEQGRGWHQHAVRGDESAVAALNGHLADAMERVLARSKAAELTPARRQRVASDAIYAAVAREVAGTSAAQAGTMAQLFAAESLQRLASSEFALAGSAGLIDECDDGGGPAAHLVDAAYATVEFGTAEVLRNDIARSLGLE